MHFASVHDGRVVIEAHDAGYRWIAVVTLPEVLITMLASDHDFALAVAAQYVEACYAVAHGYQADLF